VIRRSSTDRVVAGVAGGLGEYFGVDPVLFRVLFGVTAFFGGAGILAYLIAWAVIPDATTAQAPLDRVIYELRRRHVPVWLVAGVTVFVGWALLFSWWAPLPFLPVVVAVVILVIALSRRKSPTPTARVDPTPPAEATADESRDAPGTAAGWAPEAHAWISESRTRSRERRRRAAPVRWITLAVLAVSLAGLATADAIGGTVLPAYFWVAGGVVLAGLITGVILRRTPWTLTVLLVPAIIGLIAFGGSAASLHDGAGERTWSPASASDLDSTYRLAFGAVTLDLSHVHVDSPRTVSVTVAAGRVRIIAPPELNLRVHAKVHIGRVERTDNPDVPVDSGNAGYDIDEIIPSPASGAEPLLSVYVKLATGEVVVARA